MTLKEYNNVHYGTLETFPFISNTDLHPLYPGLYRRKNAKYVGITAIYNKKKNKYEFPVYGVYYIEKPTLCIPRNIKLDYEILNRIVAYENEGYTLTMGLPTFKTYYVDSKAEGAKLALKSLKQKQKRKRDDKIRNKSRLWTKLCWWC